MVESEAARKLLEAIEEQERIDRERAAEVARQRRAELDARAEQRRQREREAQERRQRGEA